MVCHECAVVGKERSAVALCRFCSVALCLDHLADAVREASGLPHYACRHVPGGARPPRKPGKTSQNRAIRPAARAA